MILIASPIQHSYPVVRLSFVNGLSPPGQFFLVQTLRSQFAPLQVLFHLLVWNGWDVIGFHNALTGLEVGEFAVHIAKLVECKHSPGPSMETHLHLFQFLVDGISLLEQVRFLPVERPLLLLQSFQ